MHSSNSELMLGGLLKEQLASELKQAIVEGRLAPGERIVEGAWARQFGVAQASVREAINLLISQGFLIKDAGRSARVINYNEQDILQIYQVRGAIEGLAAELACTRRADVSALDAAVERMTAAAERADIRTLIENDLAFHLALVEASGNALLADSARRLLSPLFAFIMMRVLRNGGGAEYWLNDMPKHRMITQLIREGNPALAGQYVQHCMRSFGGWACAVWDNAEGSGQGRRQRDGSRKSKPGV